MKNYYRILGVHSSAGIAEIKSAYKKLAKVYHPDKNPGDAVAEENFKLINEAYQILTDATKRARYDYQFQVPNTLHRTTQTRRSAHHRYTRNPQQQEPYYKVDTTYFKTQGLTLLVFLVIAGFCLIIVQSFRYFSDRKKVSQANAITQTLDKADTLFAIGKVKEAFFSLQHLQEDAPSDARVAIMFDSLVNEVRSRAKLKYQSRQFSSAITDYLLLREYEDPKRIETTLKIAQCQYALENYHEAVLELKQLEKERPNDLELIYEIGLIYLNNIQDSHEALSYFSKGKAMIIKKELSKDSSQPFTINADDAPLLYFEILGARAEANVVTENYPDAIEDCNLAISLRPETGKLYRLRAMANAGSAKLETVCEDLKKAKALGDALAQKLQKKYCH